MSEIKKRRKFGPWSKSEKDFIADQAGLLTVDEIAKELDRDPESIANYIRKTLGLRLSKGTNKSVTLASGINIENTLIWNELKEEFTPEELKVFLYHWNRIIVQFKEDVFPTEEMQIIDTIKLEIMMGRAAKSQKETIVKIKELKQEILALKNSGDLIALDKLGMLESQLAAQSAAFSLADKEFNDLLARKSGMLKELKATRDQRLKRIEDSKTTFVGWMSQLLSDVPLRKELGLYIEKNRLAMMAEEKRLIQPHKYTEGDVDLPILSPEILEKLEQEEENTECQKQD